MPELPEVETTRRGISPHLLQQVINRIDVHESRLRWPVPVSLQAVVTHPVDAVDRRGKYLLLQTRPGSIIIHLGMSGSLRLCQAGDPRKKHDHVEFGLASGLILRFHDPRRFGCILLHPGDPLEHKLLRRLGPEPLSSEFNGGYLFTCSRQKKSAVKNFLMDSNVVVGIGNIYASESLFLSGIRPGRAAGRITRGQYHQVAANIKRVLDNAIRMGGTTLRDFVNPDGKAGYFQQRLNVYDREGKTCRKCSSKIKKKIIGQRSSFYCPGCQR